ncbi:hypothetical protein HY450_01060 [Candidatus Pacearchaeota archaeon]|nr:hypothetical protein [Candidatus Pacearchaeota archaeon]
MATINLMIPVDPEKALRGRTRGRVNKCIESAIEYPDAEQRKYLAYGRHILEDEVPTLKDCEDLTGRNIREEYKEVGVIQTLYRALLVVGFVAEFNFVNPNADTLRNFVEDKSPIEGYQISRHLYYRTAGKFNLRLFRLRWRN